MTTKVTVEAVPHAIKVKVTNKPDTIVKQGSAATFWLEADETLTTFGTDATNPDARLAVEPVDTGFVPVSPEVDATVVPKQPELNDAGIAPRVEPGFPRQATDEELAAAERAVDARNEREANKPVEGNVA